MNLVRQVDWEADILDDVDIQGGVVVFDEVERHTMTFENAEDAFRVSRPFLAHCMIAVMQVGLVQI